jgi:hypothetical protein
MSSAVTTRSRVRQHMSCLMSSKYTSACAAPLFSIMRLAADHIRSLGDPHFVCHAFDSGCGFVLMYRIRIAREFKIHFPCRLA